MIIWPEKNLCQSSTKILLILYLFKIYFLLYVLFIFYYRRNQVSISDQSSSFSISLETLHEQDFKVQEVYFLG